MGGTSNHMEPLAVSVSKAAEMLGISRPKIYDLMRQEGFPCFKVGGRTLVSVEGLKTWIREQTVKGASA